MAVDFVKCAKFTFAASTSYTRNFRLLKFSHTANERTRGGGGVKELERCCCNYTRSKSALSPLRPPPPREQCRVQHSLATGILCPETVYSNFASTTAIAITLSPEEGEPPLYNALKFIPRNVGSYVGHNTAPRALFFPYRHITENFHVKFYHQEQQKLNSCRICYVPSNANASIPGIGECTFAISILLLLPYISGSSSVQLCRKV